MCARMFPSLRIPVPPLVTGHRDLDVCSSLHCFACECVTRRVCALATLCLSVGVGPAVSLGGMCSEEGPRWFSGCGILVLEPCVCDLGRCVSLEQKRELRTEKAVSGLPGSRGLDALTPVGLH